MKEAFGLKPDTEYTIYDSKGCNKCYNIGYKGRVAVSEVLFITEAVNIIIATEPTIKNITEIAKKENFITLQKDGILKITQGITSYDEITRILDMTEYMKKIKELENGN